MEDGYLENHYAEYEKKKAEWLKKKNKWSNRQLTKSPNDLIND
ncbi:MAG: dehydrogenase [Paludibacteraceae bacterium]|nr:dehydrogenase [Paludibacteraceae bacterium]MBR4705083.1 dehydrogenase [Paludibacteraceae bacterium]